MSQLEALAHPALNLSGLAPYFFTALLSATLSHNAAAQPVIDWVTPPVWIQTETENTSALPGTALTQQTWISTGRGGKAMIRMETEQVEINENSLWEWAGQNNDSSGNTVQGNMRVSNAALRRLSIAGVPTADKTVRLHQNADWMLKLDAGKDQGGAEGLSNFLRNSGYPASKPQRIERLFGDRWQICIKGFKSSEAAIAMGNSLLALAPGIRGTTAERAQTKVPEPVLSDAEETAPADLAATDVTPDEPLKDLASPL